MVRGRTEYTFCRICEALCGLEVDVEGDRVAAIRPDERHVVTQGFACVKGLRQHELYGSPDRLKRPLVRSQGGQIPISWDHALSGIGSEVKRIRREHGSDSVAMYVGTAAGFGTLHPVFAQGFMQGVGSRNLYSTATQDCANKFAVAEHVYGFPFTQPFPDVDRTQCLIIVGANPVVSKWSFLQVSNPGQRIKDIGNRGGKVIVVDPRRTETAKVADEHVFIRPDSDVFFFLGFLNELIASGGVERARVAAHMTGYDEVAALARPWTPERCADVTSIPADALRRLVATYRDANGAALYSSTGVNMGSGGALAFWLQEVINAVSGNLDRRGGTLVGRGIIDFAAFGKKHGLLLRKDRTRIGGLPSVNDAFPGGVLADEILTPGRGQIRALFVTGGNPLLTMANSERLLEAFEQLELLVVVDILPTETASKAHYVLPATAPLQRPDLPFLFPLLLGLQSRPYLQATREVVPPEGEQRDEATIYLDLARAAGVPLFGSRIAQAALTGLQRLWSWRHKGTYAAVPQEWLLNAILLAARKPSFRTLLGYPHGVRRRDHVEDDFLGQRVVTDDGKVRLAPQPLMSSARVRLGALYARELASKRRMKLITRRAVTSHNSWTHNHPRFTGGPGQTNYLYVNPEDAARLGLEAGGLADVRTDTATVRVPIRLLDDLMPGVVALPHGWGHQQAKGLSVASQTSGVNANLLSADGPDSVDYLSGMAHLTGIPVDVSPAEGPQAVGSWSGLPG